MQASFDFEIHRARPARSPHRRRRAHAVHHDRLRPAPARPRLSEVPGQRWARRPRPLFLPRTTRHVESRTHRSVLAREIARGAVALAGITAWGGALLLLAG
jgi:hypothetical protein